MKHAAIVVVSDGAGRFLSVSRDGDPHDIALPGGHVEEGETPEAAALRELREETGAHFVEIRQEFDDIDGERHLHVYSAHGPYATIAHSFTAEPGEYVRWASPEDFHRAKSYGAFAKANHDRLFTMPFRSEAQREWMRIHHPEMAKRWEAETAPGSLPKHVTADMGAGDAHVDSLGGMHREKPEERDGPLATPAFAQPVPPPRADVLPVPRWPLTQNVHMISAAKRASLPEGKFALPALRKYPIDTAARVRNAAARLEQNKSRLAPGDYAKAKAAIGRAAKRFGIHSEYNASGDHAATDHLVPHMHVSAVIPHGGHLHVRHLRDDGTAPEGAAFAEFRDAVTLSEAPADGPVWNQVACVGSFKGHPAGPFELNEHVFSEIVANWEHGGRKPIPVDYEHASEADATSGSIPTGGAPAQGWITHLENRGAAGLFGKIDWLPQARAQIRAGQYKFFSPAIRFGSRDKVSGRPIGARLTSGALTNQPFLDNLAQIRAKAPPADLIAAKDAPVGETSVALQDMLSDHHGPGHFITPSSEYMPKLKACMGLHPLATPDEMKDHLDRLREHLEQAGGNANANVNGVSLASYVHPLREITHGPAAGVTAEAVFDVVEHMIDSAMAEHMVAEHGASLDDASMVETDKGGAAALAGYADTHNPAVTADDTAADGGDTNMSDANIQAELNQIKVTLSTTQAELLKLRDENAALKQAAADREEADRVADVEYVMSVHADKVAHLGADDEERKAILMKVRVESPSFFAASYPRDVDPSKAYLLRQHTNANDRAADPADASETGVPELDALVANGEDPDATITRLMSEGASFEDASERALALHELLAQVSAA